ncbi:MAG: hypothetical protein ACM37V_11580, partial [Gemmatimonadota bacterium]
LTPTPPFPCSQIPGTVAFTWENIGHLWERPSREAFLRSEFYNEQPVAGASSNGGDLSPRWVPGLRAIYLTGM